MIEPRCEHLVFAGNGMSGVACVEEQLRSGQVFDITIFGTGPRQHDRMPSPSVLAGERDIDSITLNDIEWYQEHGIRTRLGIRVEEIDRLNRAVRSSDGDWTSYDKLIRRRVPVRWLHRSGVGRNQTLPVAGAALSDTRKLVDAAGPGERRARS